MTPSDRKRTTSALIDMPHCPFSRARLPSVARPPSSPRSSISTSPGARNALANRCACFSIRLASALVCGAGSSPCRARWPSSWATVKRCRSPGTSRSGSSEGRLTQMTGIWSAHTDMPRWRPSSSRIGSTRHPSFSAVRIELPTTSSSCKPAAARTSRANCSIASWSVGSPSNRGIPSGIRRSPPISATSTAKFASASC